MGKEILVSNKLELERYKQIIHANLQKSFESIKCHLDDKDCAWFLPTLTVTCPRRPSVPGEPERWLPNRQVWELTHCPAMENTHFGVWMGARGGVTPSQHGQ